LFAILTGTHVPDDLRVVWVRAIPLVIIKVVHEELSCSLRANFPPRCPQFHGDDVVHEGPSVDVSPDGDALGIRVRQGIAGLDGKLGITDATVVVAGEVEEAAARTIPGFGVVGPCSHNGVEVGSGVTVEVDEVLACACVASAIGVAVALSPDVVRAAVLGRIAVTSTVVPGSS
jgi:hypothetical protein